MTPFGYRVLGFGSSSGSSTARDENIPAASPVTFDSDEVSWVNVAYDPNTANKCVIVYRDHGNSNYGTAIVGTISGTTLSFGTPVVYESAMSSYNSIAFDPNTALKCVISYQDGGNSDRGTAIVGTVSGTSISFGTAVAFDDGQSRFCGVSYDHNSSVNKCAIAYQDADDSNKGKVAVGTISGTSISFGTPVVFNDAGTDNVYDSISFDHNTDGKCLIQYQDSGNSGYGTCIVGQISGTSMTFGSEVVYNSGSTQFGTVKADPNNADKYLLAFRADNDSDKGKALVTTVSGTTPTPTDFTYALFADHAAGNQDVSFDPSNPNKFIISYNKGSEPQNSYVIVGTISGTAISWGTAISMITTAETAYHEVSFDPNTPGMFIYILRNGTGGAGIAILGQMESA